MMLVTLIGQIALILSLLGPMPNVVTTVATGTEPAVTVDSATGNIAVAVQHVNWTRRCSMPTVQVSADQGFTWTSSRPWGNGCEDIHSVLAYGPDGTLYFVGAVGEGSGVQLAITHSSDQGRTWSARYVEKRTRAWVGCFPEIAADTDPTSPYYGTVYVVYNYPITPTDPGLAVLASTNQGRSWSLAKMSLPAVNGIFSRIGYRILADGQLNGPAAQVSYVQNGRLYVTSLFLTNGAPSFGAPTQALAGVDPWQTMIANGSGLWAVGNARGKIEVGHQTGTGWTNVVMGSGVEPVVAAQGQTIMVGWHSGSPRRNWYRMSYDGGTTWGPATSVGPTWRPLSVMNGSGLRQNVVWSGGSFYWVFAAGARVVLVTIPD
jgi:hypothetical protein